MSAPESPVPDDGVRSRQRQLAGDLRALILSGDLAPGDRLPSTGELTRRYGINRSYYPVDIARGTALAEHRLITGGSPTVLAGLGFPARRAVDQIAARFATVAEFVALALPEDVPVLRQFRVVYTDGDRPVEASVMIKAGQQYEVQYELPEPT